MSNNTTAIYRGWMDSPNNRGTSDLLYNCLLTVFLCTWSTLHMNLPAKSDSPMVLFFRQLKWMFTAILAPELMVALAFDQFSDAKLTLKSLKEAVTKQNLDCHWSLTHGFLVGMGGISLKTNDESIFRPNPPHFVQLVTEGHISISDINFIDIKDVDDRNKSNWMLKSLTMAQILWFVLQIIGRGFQHLPTTTLELFTLGIVSLTVLTYALWWKKPYDVSTPFLIDTDMRIEDLELAFKDSLYSNNSHPGTRFSLLESYSPASKSYDIAFSIVVLSACLMFGACHLIGWNFYFGTAVERWLWRTSSLLCFLLPILISSISILLEDSSETLLHVVAVVAGSLYIVVRGFLLVEVFTGLRAMPIGVYRNVDWAKYLPHI